MRIGTAILCAAIVAGAMSMGAQTVPGQLKLDDQQARRQLLESLTSAGATFGAAGKAFVAVPAAARAAIIDAGFAWMKTYVNSAVFKTAYAQARESAKPSPPDAQGTVDQELKRQQDEQTKQMADSRKVLDMVPADQRASLEETLKQAEAQLKNPEMVKMMRMQIEEQRKEDQSRYQESLKSWQEDYPVNPLVLVGRRLQQFLAISVDVDFTAKLVKTPGGTTRFANADYEAKSGEWKTCFRAGREAVTAARADAAVWLKELPAK